MIKWQGGGDLRVQKQKCLDELDVLEQNAQKKIDHEISMGGPSESTATSAAAKRETDKSTAEKPGPTRKRKTTHRGHDGR